MGKRNWKLTKHDKEILRELGKRKLEIANEPCMEEKKKLWYKHNSLKSERPMVILESGGVGKEFLDESSLKCEEKWARDIEFYLRSEILHYEKIGDDKVVDPFIRCNWKVDISDIGVKIDIERGVDIQGKTLGFKWNPPLKNLKNDFEKLKYQKFTVDREETFAWKSFLEEVFEGILPVVIRGSFWWSMGFTQIAIYLVGLDNFMLFMYDDPEGIHKLMRFLKENKLFLAKGLEKEGVLTLNNENDYIGSGSYGFTDELPQKDWKKEDIVRLKDLWALLESQETVGISPQMFEEFIAPYYREIAQYFGLIYYGCCEPTHSIWESIKKINNLRSVSISPWCNQSFMAEMLGKNYIFSRKPPPSLLSTGFFDENAIREDIRKTLNVAKKCNIEFIMKDLHTVNNQPQRMSRWVQIVYEEISKFYS